MSDQVRIPERDIHLSIDRRTTGSVWVCLEQVFTFEMTYYSWSQAQRQTNNSYLIQVGTLLTNISRPTTPIYVCYMRQQRHLMVDAAARRYLYANI